MHEPITVDVNDGGTIATVAIPVDGKGMDAASEAALATLRDEIVLTTVGALPNAEVGVTGMTAKSKDFNDKLALGRRSCSGSCSSWRSCSCSSRSDRS